MSEAPAGEGLIGAATRQQAEAALGGLLLLFAASLPLSIAAAQLALALAAGAWLVAGAPRAAVPAGLPALLYALLSLLSALASPVPLDSLRDSKKLLLFAILLLVPAATARRPWITARLGAALLAGSAVAAGYGIAKFLSAGGGLENRTSGFFGHYMTFGGVLMLAALLAFARLAEARSARAARMVLLGLLLWAIAASYARNVWIGLPFGLLVVAALLRPRWLLPVALVPLLAYLLMPAAMRERALSSFRLAPNQDRVEMLRFGAVLIAERPWLGVGPNRMRDAFLAHGPQWRVQPHLHNNLVQIAAERGLPAALVWLWLMASLAALALRAHRRQPGALPAAALGAVLALFVAGAFEYNFGDAEVKMTFLLLVALGSLTPSPGTVA